MQRSGRLYAPSVAIALVARAFWRLMCSQFMRNSDRFSVHAVPPLDREAVSHATHARSTARTHENHVHELTVSLNLCLAVMEISKASRLCIVKRCETQRCTSLRMFVARNTLHPLSSRNARHDAHGVHCIQMRATCPQRRMT